MSSLISITSTIITSIMVIRSSNKKNILMMIMIMMLMMMMMMMMMMIETKVNAICFDFLWNHIDFPWHSFACSETHHLGTESRLWGSKISFWRSQSEVLGVQNRSKIWHWIGFGICTVQNRIGQNGVIDFGWFWRSFWESKIDQNRSKIDLGAASKKKLDFCWFLNSCLMLLQPEAIKKTSVWPTFSNMSTFQNKKSFWSLWGLNNDTKIDQNRALELIKWRPEKWWFSGSVKSSKKCRLQALIHLIQEPNPAAGGGYRRGPPKVSDDKNC